MSKIQQALVYLSKTYPHIEIEHLSHADGVLHWSGKGEGGETLAGSLVMERFTCKVENPLPDVERYKELMQKKLEATTIAVYVLGSITFTFKNHYRIWAEEYTPAELAKRIKDVEGRA